MAREAAAVVGARIRRLREQRELSQQELAARVGKSQAALSFWEKGRRAPDLVDLMKIAEALAVDVGTLFPERPRMVLRAQLDRVFADHLPDEVERFAAEVEQESAPQVELTVANDSPVGAAQELLATAGIVAPPVPAEKLARLCGVRVRALPASFGEGISGLLLELPSGPVIGYRDSDNRGRRHFTIAHELGHHLLRHYENFHIDVQAMAELGNPPGHDWRDEREANDFAAQLLMPAALVTQEYASQPKVSRLAAKFKVSQEAMGWRLVNLGLR
jgi:transcriptional regulator with XRE-family HTH domain